MQPGSERAVAAEFRETSVRADKGVLGDFLGRSAVPQHAPRNLKHPVAITGDDFHESRLVPGVERLHQCGVEQRLPAGRSGAFGSAISDGTIGRGGDESRR